MKITTQIFVLFAMLSLKLPNTSKADTFITDPLTSGGQVGSADYATWGYDFSVGRSSLLVESLGMWDRNGDGLRSSHYVGLWDSTGILLADVIVPAGNSPAIDGLFQYASLSSPVTLLANEHYVIGVTYSANDRFDRMFNSYGASFNSAILPGDTRKTLGAGFPDEIISSDWLNIGPNAQFTVIPEPSSALFVLCFGGVFLCLTTAGPNHARQQTRPLRYGCNPRVPWAGSLSLGR